MPTWPARSFGRMHGKNHLAVQHSRLMPRQGRGRAQLAVAHSNLTTACYILQRISPTRDLDPEWLEKRNEEAHTRCLVTQLKCFEHTVALDRAADLSMTHSPPDRHPAKLGAPAHIFHGSVTGRFAKRHFWLGSLARLAGLYARKHLRRTDPDPVPAAYSCPPPSKFTKEQVGCQRQIT